MVNNCANPRCAKPLHYLREGRIFVFDVLDSSSVLNGKSSRHLEHYWLCGTCAQQFQIERNDGTESGVRLVPRRRPTTVGVENIAGTALAS
jgi:hypothetical protein